ncbi:MAG: hypothetical protein ABIH21_04875 [Patescibacteria group bacterium]
METIKQIVMQIFTALIIVYALAIGTVACGLLVGFVGVRQMLQPNNVVRCIAWLCIVTTLISVYTLTGIAHANNIEWFVPVFVAWHLCGFTVGSVFKLAVNEYSVEQSEPKSQQASVSAS